MTIEEIITDVLRNWGVEFAQKRVNALREFTATEDTLRSVRQEISGELQKIQRFSFAMKGSPRILDMRPSSLSRSKLGRIKEIEEWVKAIGVSAFTKNEDHKKRAFVLGGGDRLANSIAWGVAKKQLQRGGRFKKARKWYNKPVYTEIGSLYGRMLAAIRENTADELKQSFGSR